MHGAGTTAPCDIGKPETPRHPDLIAKALQEANQDQGTNSEDHCTRGRGSQHMHRQFEIGGKPQHRDLCGRGQHRGHISHGVAGRCPDVIPAQHPRWRYASEFDKRRQAESD